MTKKTLLLLRSENHHGQTGEVLKGLQKFRYINYVMVQVSDCGLTSFKGCKIKTFRKWTQSNTSSSSNLQRISNKLFKGFKGILCASNCDDNPTDIKVLVCKHNSIMCYDSIPLVRVWRKPRHYSVSGANDRNGNVLRWCARICCMNGSLYMH